ncbi:hypothetical protein ACFV30_31440 [Streptomyces sp. NPDC059752]|uniref:hypothetical protein n=1 Tax=unclassified Streptomyces TaxID=2593676 RepID=UPI00364BBD1E
MGVQRCSNSVLISADGELNEDAGRVILQALDHVTASEQPQHQRLMAEVAGVPGPGTATGERYAVAGLRRLLEDRAQRARDHADFAAGWLPRA